MIESKAAVYLGDNHAEEDSNEIKKFVYENGNAIHSWIVDEIAINNSIGELENT